MIFQNFYKHFISIIFQEKIVRVIYKIQKVFDYSWCLYFMELYRLQRTIHRLTITGKIIKILRISCALLDVVL